MKKTRPILHSFAFFFVWTLTTFVPQTEALAKVASKSTAKSENKLPTRLPPYKGKKNKITVDFDNATSKTETVVIRSEQRLERAQEKAAKDQGKAQKAISASSSGATQPKAKPAQPSSTPATEKVTAETSPTAPLERTEAPAQAQVNEIESGPAIVTARVNSESIADSGPSSTGFGLGVETHFIQFRTHYWSTRFERISGELENGATSVGLSWTRKADLIDWRIAIDVVHGMDQAVTIQNTRMVAVRGEALYGFGHGPVFPYVGAGLGIVDYSVRSQRASTDETLRWVEHASGTALALIPSAGIWMGLGENLRLDFQLDYIGAFGSGASHHLGSLTAGASFGLSY